MPEIKRGAPDYIHQIEILDEEDLWERRSTMGLAELAARLGAPLRYVKTGRFYWYDSFESGLSKWATAGDGANWAVELSAEKAHYEKYSCKMTAGTTLEKRASIAREAIIVTALSNLGIELSFNFDTELDWIEWILYMYTGTAKATFEIHYDYVNQKLEYRDHGNIMRDLKTSVNLGAETNLFHAAKLVVDPVNLKYLRLYVDNVIYPMTDKGCYSVEDLVTAPQLGIAINNHSSGAISSIVYIDGVILTHAEPAV